MVTDWDLAVAKTTAWCEARGAGKAGMAAVIWSLINRARIGAAYAAAHGVPHPLFGAGHLSEAALDPLQYSTFNRDTGDWRNLRARCIASDTDASLVLATVALAEAVGGQPDPTGGATHYYDESITPPSWTAGATETVVIDRLHFFTGVK